MFSFSKHDVNGEDEESLPPPPPTHPPPADSVYTTETSVTPSGASESCCTDSGDDSDEDSSESDSESEASEQDEKSNVIDKEGDEGEEAGDIDLEKQPLGIPSNKPREESAVDKDTIDEIIEYEYDEESRTSRNKLYVALIAGLLLVIAVVLGVGYGTGSFGGNSTNSAQSGAPPTALVSPMPSTAGPVSAPTSSSSPPTKPTAATVTPTPTNAPTTTTTIPAPTVDRLVSFTDHLSGMSSNPSALTDPTTPEGKALQWLVNDDPLVLDAMDDSPENLLRLHQRYSLATLYFTTSTPWKNDTNWLNNDECQWFGVTCYPASSGSDLAVQSLQLIDNALTGSFPPDLAP